VKQPQHIFSKAVMKKKTGASAHEQLYIKINLMAMSKRAGQLTWLNTYLSVHLMFHLPLLALQLHENSNHCLLMLHSQRKKKTHANAFTQKPGMKACVGMIHASMTHVHGWISFCGFVWTWPSLLCTYTRTHTHAERSFDLTYRGLASSSTTRQPSLATTSGNTE
jgi:hypothetical protein